MREAIIATSLEEFKAKMREVNVNYIGLTRSEKLEYNRLKGLLTTNPVDKKVDAIVMDELKEIEAKNEVSATFGADFVKELVDNVEEVTVEDKEYWTSTKNGILNTLYDRIKDGDFRSILLKEREKNVETKDDVIVCIQKLTDSVRDGESRGIIYEYVTQLRK